jgi:hypothetical protein
MKNQASGNDMASPKRQAKIDQASKRISKGDIARLSTTTTSAPANTLSPSAGPHPMAPNSVKGGQD